MVGMTDTLSKLDYEALHGPMTNRLTALGRSLTAEQSAAPSLRDGWRVCDVFGHMTYGGATPMYRVLPRLLFLYRGNLNRGSAVESVRYADTHTQDAVMTEFERSSHHPVGIGKVIKASDDLLLAMCGRPAGLATLHGGGVVELTRRIGR